MMAKLVLLNLVLFLLVAIGNSIAWPSYSDEAQRQDTLSDELELENRHAVASSYFDEAKIDTYDEDADTADDEVAIADDNHAEINWRRRGRRRRRKRPKKPRSCGCDLRAYDKSSYKGRSLLLRQQNANFLNDYFNDRVESVRVYGKCQWLLYQDINFDGQSYIVNPGSYSSASRWGGRDNHISSARALPAKGTKAIVLFQHADFRGRMLVLEGSNPNLPAIDFNDQLSSFIITGGRWTLYEHTSYQGKSVTLGPGQYTSASALGGAGDNDQISSIKALKYLNN